jgi:anaphase-promoting complex subunit 4
MTNSRLALFFEDAEPDDIKSDWGSSEQDLPKFDLLDQQLRKHEDGQSHMKALPKLALLCKHLEKQSNAIFQQIAEAEKRNVLFGQPSDLGAASADGLIAMIVVPQVCQIQTAW